MSDKSSFRPPSSSSHMFTSFRKAISGLCGCAQQQSSNVDRHSTDRSNSNHDCASEVDSLLQLAAHVVLEESPPPNFVFSPLSMRLGLSFAAAGAGGTTLDQMLSFLGHRTVKQLNSDSRLLLKSVLTPGTGDSTNVDCSSGGGEPPKFNSLWLDESFPPSKLSVVNSLWVDESFPLKQSFRDVASSIYGSEEHSVDFRHKPLEATSEVNAWVARETNNLIKEIIPPESVDRMTRLILVNALYFKATWSTEFFESNTKNYPFHLLNGEHVSAPFMTQDDYQYVASYTDFKVLSLPYNYANYKYKGHNFSFNIFLANKRDGVIALLERVASEPAFIKTHIPQKKVVIGKLLIPKFKISFKCEASDVMKKMGLVLPFSELEANFRKMCHYIPTDVLYLYRIHHKATVEVNEKGTEATAATGMAFQEVCLLRGEPIDFVADHPFLFVIREDMNDVILFLGIVTNPLLVE